MAYWWRLTPLKTWHMGWGALDNGDATSAVIPIRKITDLHGPASPT